VLFHVSKLWLPDKTRICCIIVYTKDRDSVVKASGSALSRNGKILPTFRGKLPRPFSEAFKSFDLVMYKYGSIPDISVVIRRTKW
jgi:hypothetical protein